MFIAECVLVYMAPEHGDALLTWIASNFDAAAWINYDPVCILSQTREQRLTSHD